MVDWLECYNASSSDMQRLVAIDLETTGLDPARDAVIEVGAVRFRDSRVEDEWQTLINPGRPLPPLITNLTGITDPMLANAPRFSEVLPDLETFVGDLPILGHNIQFDLAFLSRKGIFKDNPSVDTFDLASVLLPNAGRYGLVALARMLGIPARVAHRALDDAHTTRQIYLRLYEQSLDLPEEILEEITRLGAEIDWGADRIFDLAYEQKGGEPQTAQAERQSFLGPFQPKTSDYTPLTPSVEKSALDVDEIASTIEPGGPLAKQFEAYEHRPQQVTMLRAVAKAISDQQHLLVEAGTGTGKSMAYLIPAFAWASQNNERVVISTNTINLQDQLIHKDIPDLNRALSQDYRAAVLKGRTNYLCPRRLAALRQLGPRSAEEMRVLAKILVWLSRGGSGDRSEINLPRGESAVWARISADYEDCSLEGCQMHTGGICPYYQARVAALSSQVVIVNHALLLADIVTGNRVIPEYQYLIVDEAHHLESATTHGLSFRVTEVEVIRHLRDLGSSNSGLLRQILETGKSELPPEAVAKFEGLVKSISDRIQVCLEGATLLFSNLTTLLSNRREDQPIGPYGQQVRILPATRTLPDWQQVEMTWEDLRTPLSAIVQMLSELSDGLMSLFETGIESAENLSVATSISSRSLEEFHTHLEHMIFEPDPNQIYWLEIQSGQERVIFHAAPLEVGSLVEKYLWHEKEAVIMTSATLTTAGEFGYMRRRLNAHDADELALGSPFDYETSTLLYLINDIPEPFERQAYQRNLESGLLALCRETGGRALVLFTSNNQLRQTARALAEPLGAEGIQLLEQSSGAPRHSLLESFRALDQAVLFGTRSFWEGVDVPGEALSVLAIVRLPFDVPSNPIIAARAETFESPFLEYTVPEAILRFRQGFGRLIRTRSDRGVVAIFDRRIISKRYGQAFIDSLPRCTIRSGSLTDLPKAAARWLGI